MRPNDSLRVFSFKVAAKNVNLLSIIRSLVSSSCIHTTIFRVSTKMNICSGFWGIFFSSFIHHPSCIFTVRGHLLDMVLTLLEIGPYSYAYDEVIIFLKNTREGSSLLKSIHHKVDCLLLRNAHKMTRQAALNVCNCTASEPVCVHCSR